MRIVINDIPLELGEALPEDARTGAGLRRPGLWRRLRDRTAGAGTRLDADNCVIDAFDGRFHLYPCTHEYLNADRQWRTAVSVFVERGRVRSVLLRVIEGRYAAGEFVDRFCTVCTEQLGEGLAVDSFTRRWRNGAAACRSCLQPDGRNACFIIEMIEA
ncbi:MAG: hypothetical protein R6X35_04195 [Candidatus Krumholzibacteriia bacterium]